MRVCTHTCILNVAYRSFRTRKPVGRSAQARLVVISSRGKCYPTDRRPPYNGELHACLCGAPPRMGELKCFCTDKHTHTRTRWRSRAYLYKHKKTIYIIVCARAQETGINYRQDECASTKIQPASGSCITRRDSVRACIAVCKRVLKRRCALAHTLRHIPKTYSNYIELCLQCKARSRVGSHMHKSIALAALGTSNSTLTCSHMRINCGCVCV